ncbi:MAG: DUF4269 domain-containing protein [Planctomycetota bacterium]
MRVDYTKVIQDLALLDRLSEFDPMLIGTPPLGIGIDSSDIDVACSSSDVSRFKMTVTGLFGQSKGFQIRETVLQSVPAVIAGFRSHGWDIELFCQTTPTNLQWGVRHFMVEKRLLRLEPRLRKTVVELKQAGMKTEPAFAKALGLSGKPYAAVLALEELDDVELMRLIGDSRK